MTTRQPDPTGESMERNQANQPMGRNRAHESTERNQANEPTGRYRAHDSTERNRPNESDAPSRPNESNEPNEPSHLDAANRRPSYADPVHPYQPSPLHHQNSRHQNPHHQNPHLQNPHLHQNPHCQNPSNPSNPPNRLNPSNPPNPSKRPNPPRNACAPRSLDHGLLWSLGALLLGAYLVYNSVDTTAEPKPRDHPAAVAAAKPRATASAIGPALPRSAPKRLIIPEIAVDAPFAPLTVGASGRLNAPAAGNTNLVGWYRDGASPGERGSSIVAGHVDTKTGPAVFLQLSTLKPGSTIEITREDGIIATFKVDSVETFNKADFPNDRVYADTPSAQLRLITCGGAYDHKAKDYVDNVVVFAHLASSKRSG